MTRRLGLAVAAALLAVTGCAGPAAGPGTSPDPAGSATTTTPATSAAPTPATASSTAPGDDADTVPVVKATPPAPADVIAPTRLAVPSLDLDLPVIPVGVEDDGSMELPGSVRTIGWYRFGPVPVGSQGTTVLAAHVDSRTEGVGPFAELRDVDRGATVTLRLADGDQQSYRVTRVHSYPKQQVPLDSVFATTGSARLILITCGGAYDRGHGGYQDNLVVEAVPR